MLEGPEGNDLKLTPGNKKLEFDPIRQHRHFCPWIASAHDASMPGWKQVLSALDRVKVVPGASSPSGSPSTLSICEAEMHGM
ncbi:hypothetical protein ACLOJK_032409 [Asimina triloba]